MESKFLKKKEKNDENISTGDKTLQNSSFWTGSESILLRPWAHLHELLFVGITAPVCVVRSVKSLCIVARGTLESSAEILFSKLNQIFMGYFDPINTAVCNN